MRSLIIISAMLAGYSLLPGKPVTNFIDPTGTYILVGDVKKNLVVSPSGEIRVQLLSNNRLAICFYMNKGYPGYQSGAFTDTLDYAENEARYTPRIDTNCTIVFTFSLRKVELMTLYKDPHCTCGFDPGVLTATTFTKTSGDKPIIQDLAIRRVQG
jgi:hypothetical protein